MSLQWFKGFAVVSLFCGATMQAGAINSKAYNAERGAELFLDKGCVGCHQADDYFGSGDFTALQPRSHDELTVILMSFRAGEPSDSVMSAISARLSDRDIGDLSAYLSVNN